MIEIDLTFTLEDCDTNICLVAYIFLMLLNMHFLWLKTMISHVTCTTVGTFLGTLVSVTHSVWAMGVTTIIW